MIQRAGAVAHKFFLELVNQAQTCTYNQPHLRAADQLYIRQQRRTHSMFNQTHPCEALQQHPHDPAQRRHAVEANLAEDSAV